jgi:hypothetical protein
MGAGRWDKFEWTWPGAEMLLNGHVLSGSIYPSSVLSLLSCSTPALAKGMQALGNRREADSSELP